MVVGIGGLVRGFEVDDVGGVGVEVWFCIRRGLGRNWMWEKMSGALRNFVVFGIFCWMGSWIGCVSRFCRVHAAQLYTRGFVFHRDASEPCGIPLLIRKAQDIEQKSKISKLLVTFWKFDIERLCIFLTRVLS